MAARRTGPDRALASQPWSGGWLLLTLSLLLLLTAGSPAQAQPAFRVIVHPDNPVSALSNAQISDIFLKKLKLWENGTTIEPVDLSGEPGVREAFSKDVHGRSTDNVRSFWNQEVFSGRAVPPLELPSSSAVVEYVASHPSAIGYISGQTGTEGVKILGGIVPPKLISRVEPNYTGPARTAHVSGDVVLTVEVDVTGSVGRIRTIKELGFGLTNEAIAAVKRWKFQPAMRDGKPVTQEVMVTIRFAP
jgi:TonB family protein